MRKKFMIKMASIGAVVLLAAGMAACGKKTEAVITTDGEEFSEPEMREALGQVDLLGFVEENGGLDMEILEKGANLSGGQKQRLALARALLHDSPVYIFDEATSNVDVESENKIMEIVQDLAREKSVILISHRLANVTAADKILYMEQGKIAESGTHEQLMAQNKAYAALFNKQQELEHFREEAV